jgi:phosphinothricin acetyltransferase
MQMIETRLAQITDSPAIAAIYNREFAERIATFETESRTAVDIAAQLTDKGERFPTIIVERKGSVFGFASASPYRNRACYAGIAEHSVYGDTAARGAGIGRVALVSLIRTYRSRGFWKLVSRIFPESKASLKLHEGVGFRTVGVYHRHAQLDGIWRDCVIVELLLDPGLSIAY